ncbi:unnamed protein product [Spirodela intermedia]|uniref:Uncharacterized protein n=1 Tax=Spirodela intermedia TaxID=51605 RepID=A0A7I8JCL5_SPIIN|nr:unnamed protein product [Spirodela intermedia]CAA6667887.1 unnamed protein product [Spirodela intermedia]
MGSAAASSSSSSSRASSSSVGFLPLPCSSFVFFLLILRLLLGGLKRRLHGYGPRAYPVLGCLVSFFKNKHRLLDWYTELLAASPTQTIVVSRLGAVRTVITANPANVEHILKTNFDNYPKGKPFTDMLGDLLGNGIFNADGELWHTQRKLASHEFTARLLRGIVVGSLEAEMEGRLAPILGAAADGGQAVDMQELFKRFAFDNICMISLGMDPGCLEPSMPDRGAAPVPAVWKLKRALGIGSERVLREKMAIIHNSIMELINRRKEGQLDGTVIGDDFLSKLISAGYAEEEDTTSSALTWLFWLLSRYPDVEQKLVEEATKRKGSLDYQTLKEMTWLEACLYESMRLYPPVAWDSKHAAGDDVLPDGIPVSSGTGEKETVKMSAFKYPVFQGGPRVCLGKEMAFIQMKYVVVSVLRRFQLRPVSSVEPVFVPLMTAHMAGGLRVVVSWRCLEKSGHQ